MMTPRSYIVRLPYPYRQPHLTGNLGILMANAFQRINLLSRASTWLLDNQRATDVLDIQDDPKGQMMFWLTSRDTALLLRLAIQ